MLQQKTPASVPAGFAAIDIALTPDGRSAYVTNQGDDTLSQYDVDPAGRPQYLLDHREPLRELL